MKQLLLLTLILISQGAQSGYQVNEIDRYKAIYTQLIKQNISTPKCTIKIKGYKEKSDMKIYSVQAMKGSSSDCEKILKAVMKVNTFPLPSDESTSDKLIETTLYIE